MNRTEYVRHLDTDVRYRVAFTSDCGWIVEPDLGRIGPALSGASTMNEEYYKVLNAELGAEFDLFALENPEWMATHVPAGALVVLQTDDPGFNAWARHLIESTRHLEQPPRSAVLVHIRELQPAHSRIIRAEAELLAG